MTEVLPLIAYGQRVWVQTVTPADLAPYRRAVQASVARIRRWNPVNPDDLVWHLREQSVDHRTFIIHAHQRLADYDIVGKVNVMNVVRGRFQSGTMGYDSYEPYAGQGLFSEGLRLVLDLAFASVPDGMGLHRVEADVRPGNETSAGLLRSLGLRREGHVRDMLWLESDGVTQWRDHDTYAVTAPDWPAPAFRPHAPLRMTVLVGGEPDEGRADLARRLAAELGIPAFSSQMLGLPEASTLWRLWADSPVGAVLEHSWQDTDHQSIEAALEAEGLSPEQVPVVWWAPEMPRHGRQPGLHVHPDVHPDARSLVAMALRVRAVQT